jgi:ubiquinone/menaquinone biosynthesis C-methylase UbiE
MSPDHEHDVDRFDQWSRTYEESWMQRAFFEPAHSATLDLAARLVAQPASILDVGCGTGKLLRRASARWPQARLIGVDPAKGMVELAQRLTPAATFFTGAAESLPLQDGSVELALSTISFHHWQDQVAGVREIARVLRPGGYFVLVDLAFPHWLVRLLRFERVHSLGRLRAIFSQAGLRVRTQQKVVWPVWLATIGEK